jgi:putative hydrolase of the HAD superfamily
MVILFDADGVVIAPRKKFFTERLMETYGVSKEQAMEFVHNILLPSMNGNADLRIELPKYLKAWGIDISIDEMLDFWWSGEKELNENVLQVITELKQKGIQTGLASDQERNRAEYIMKDLGLQDYFDITFFSCFIGYKKDEKESWEFVLTTFKELNPHEIVFWDDDQKNVEIAISLGIDARYYQEFSSFKEQTYELIEGKHHLPQN